MGNLKPCPFCGGEDITYYVGDDGYIQCATCLGTMPFRYGVPHDEGKAKATAAWNTRANEDRTIVFASTDRRENISPVLVYGNRRREKGAGH